MTSHRLLFVAAVAACTGSGNESMTPPDAPGGGKDAPAAVDAPGPDACAQSTYYRDGDGDGHGDPASMQRACTRPAGYVDTAMDCDDDAAAINPGASEICDTLDNDCDALVDSADASLDLASATSYYRDQDNDQVGAGTAMKACTKPSGWVTAMGDCDDNDASTKPGAPELCDGADNDCDGGTDGTVANPNRCATLVGTYAGTYRITAQEKLGMTVINEMRCTGTGSASLMLNRDPAVQGTFNCTYPQRGLFDGTQQMTLRAEVALDGTVTGTAEHRYRASAIDGLRRTYNVTGTLTATTLMLSGTGTVLPHPMSAVPWEVTFDVMATRSP